MPSAALEPHPATPCAALRAMKASVERNGAALRVLYVWDGEIARLRIPEPTAPRAAERLWQHTCCELFVARPAESRYFEFNLSPSGEWAAYEFDSYREGRRSLMPTNMPIAIGRSKAAPGSVRATAARWTGARLRCRNRAFAG